MQDVNITRAKLPIDVLGQSFNFRGQSEATCHHPAPHPQRLPYRLCRGRPSIWSRLILPPERGGLGSVLPSRSRYIKISIDQCHWLLEASASEAGVEDLGLRMSENRRLSNLGPLALATRDASSLREMVHAVIRYLPLHTDVLALFFEESDDLAIITAGLISSRLSSARQLIEMAVGVTYRVMGQLRGSPGNNWLVWFSHSSPKDITTHLRVFGPRVEFARDFNAIICTVRDLDTPLPTADPVMARHVKQYLEPLLARINATVSDKVRQLVYETLPSGRCSVKQIASSIGMDRRTLHRHLTRDGETFSSIVDAARADLARRYVEDRARSLSEVAYLLGFSGASAFSRWFRERFGGSPTSRRTADHERIKSK
jgi:AraC-like DNA-binding protein